MWGVSIILNMETGSGSLTADGRPEKSSDSYKTRQQHLPASFEIPSKTLVFRYCFAKMCFSKRRLKQYYAYNVCVNNITRSVLSIT